MGQEAVELVLRVADVDQNEHLSQDQLLFAVRAWYAWSNFPEWLDTALAEYFPDNKRAPVPSAETLHALLLDLNQLQPVDQSEATTIREVALCLGAKEDSADAKQLRQALAVWYLHVERLPTDPSDLMSDSVSEAHMWIMRSSGLQQVWDGNCERKAASTRVVVFMSLFLGAALPSFEMLVSRQVPTPTSCEHPHLSALLHATGLLGLVFTIALLMTSGATTARMPAGIACTWTFTCTTAVILTIVHLFGLSQVLTSTGDRCGAVLWHVCHFVYLTLPSLLIFVACCGLPFLYCFMGGAELLENHDADAALVKSV